MGGDRRQPHADRGRDHHGNDEGETCRACFFRSHQGSLILLGHIGGTRSFVHPRRPILWRPARTSLRRRRRHPWVKRVHLLVGLAPDASLNRTSEAAIAFRTVWTPYAWQEA